MTGERLLKGLRHPLRLVATAVVAVLVVYGFASGWALAATLLGVVVGQPAGELAGRTRARLPLVGAALLLIGGAGWFGGSALTHYGVVSSLIGPGPTLHARAFLQFGATAFTLTASLRALAARHEAAQALELAALALGFAAAFSGHRHGAVARPLWLSDWAWRSGYDPAQVLLGIGGGLGVLLLVLLLLESKHRLSLASAGLLPILAAIAVSVVDTADLAPKTEAAELAEIKEAMGDPPVPHDAENHNQGTTGDAPESEEPGERPPDAGQRDAKSKQTEGSSSTEPAPRSEEGPSADGEGSTERQGNAESAPDPKQTPVAVVVLGDDYHPPSQGFYLREAAHSQFNGSRLLPASRSDVDLDLPAGFPLARTEVAAPPPPDDRENVHAYAVLLAEHSAPVALEGAHTFEPMINPNPSYFRTAYRFEALAQSASYEDLFGRSAGDPDWSDEVLQHYLAHPTDTRYATLATTLVAQIPEDKRGDPFAQALRIKLYLDENTKYSTRERHAGVTDPTADYLFGNLIGYCVHTAHASVYLWRSLGIPARVGTGYLVFEEARRGSTLAVMGGDAHAWPELYLDGLGWVILDVAPGENLDPVAPPVDEELIQMLAEMARERPQTDPTPPSDIRQVRRFLAYTLAGLAAFTLAWITALHGLVKVWRRVRLVFAGPRTVPRVGYRCALDRLSEAGIHRRHGETREDFARRVGDLAPAFAIATNLHLDARLGDPKRAMTESPSFDRTRWRNLLRRIHVELVETTPLWRRLTGLLNPFSFYGSR